MKKQRNVEKSRYSRYHVCCRYGRLLAMDFSGITLKAKNEVHDAKKKIQSALAQQIDPVPTGNPRRVVSGPGNAKADSKQLGRKRDHDIPVGNLQFHPLPETVNRSAHPGENDTYSAKT